ncbi:hypothetical protein ASPCADRAFT_10092 [Aspergillus carbonarius ITEM 5010]|uniref:Uncharacterized protein n=1 Tax=Aspergillus carbonarius (strain ITEM 5010) TaxID=602072 RepID=A0A1R3R8Z1_ASPC5|nr:hypothetical protein ASPCADRAFT_10092 [Aspergillus carbonarius ITEM 5010]
MAEPFSVERTPSYSKPGPLRTRRFLFRAYLILLSFCAMTALLLAAISTHRTNEIDAFRSSIFVTDLERILNSTACALSNHSFSDSECGSHSAERFTGQTTLPGQCIPLQRVIPFMVEVDHPPANGFGIFAQKIYNPISFSKGYNFVLWVISAGDLLG